MELAITPHASADPLLPWAWCPVEQTLEHPQIDRRFRIVKTLVRAKNESVVINDEIIVTVLDVNDEEVVLAVDAPEWVEVFPTEASDGAETMLSRPR